jgi:hypothetical protein
VEQSGRSGLAYIRGIHEMLFSASIAFLSVSLAFIASPSLSVPFIHMEVSVNRFLHIRQTDFIRGYLEFLIPSLVLALCIGTLLHLFLRSGLAKEILRSGAGIALLYAPAVFWFCYYQATGWPFGWPYRGAPLELLAALVCAMLFLYGRVSIPGWCGILLLAAHYAFWYWMPSTNPARADYAGPIAPVLGFSSTVAWGIYVARQRRDGLGETPINRGGL